MSRKQLGLERQKSWRGRNYSKVSQKVCIQSSLKKSDNCQALHIQGKIPRHPAESSSCDANEPSRPCSNCTVLRKQSMENKNVVALADTPGFQPTPQKE